MTGIDEQGPWRVVRIDDEDVNPTRAVIIRMGGHPRKLEVPEKTALPAAG